MVIELGLLGSIALSLGSSIVTKFLANFFKDKAPKYELSHSDLKRLQEGVLDEIRSGDASHAPEFTRFYSILTSMNDYLESIKDDTAHIRTKVDHIDQCLRTPSGSRREDGGSASDRTKSNFTNFCSVKEESEGNGGFNIIENKTPGLRERVYRPDCKYFFKTPAGFFKSSKYICRLKQNDCPYYRVHRWFDSSED